MDTQAPNPKGPWQPSSVNRSLGPSHGKLLFILEPLIPAAILLVIAVGMVSGYLQKWLWMGQ